MWLPTGYELWQEMSKESGFVERDFLLACPNKALSGIIRRVAKYGMACQLSQSLFKELKTDFEDAESWGVGLLLSTKPMRGPSEQTSLVPN